MKQDTFGKLKFHIFLQGALFLKDLQGTRFKESHVVLKFKPLISVAYEHKKGGEKFLPKCGHIDVATLMWPSPGECTMLLFSASSHSGDEPCE